MSVHYMSWEWTVLCKFPSFDNRWTTAEKLAWFDDFQRLCRALHGESLLGRDL